LFHDLVRLVESETKDDDHEVNANKIADIIENRNFGYNSTGKNLIYFRFNKFASKKDANNKRYVFSIRRRGDMVPDYSRANAQFGREEARRNNRRVRFGENDVIEFNPVRSRVVPAPVIRSMGPWGPRMHGPRQRPQVAQPPRRLYSMFHAFPERR